MKPHRITTADAPASRIPVFRSRQEEAEWWDNHDVTDYLDELEPVKVTVSDELSETVTIRLGATVMKHIRASARERGIDPASLLTVWVLERLEADDRPTD